MQRMSSKEEYEKEQSHKQVYLGMFVFAQTVRAQALLEMKWDRKRKESRRHLGPSSLCIGWCWGGVGRREVLPSSRPNQILIYLHVSFSSCRRLMCPACCTFSRRVSCLCMYS